MKRLVRGGTPGRNGCSPAPRAPFGVVRDLGCVVAPSISTFCRLLRLPRRASPRASCLFFLSRLLLGLLRWCAARRQTPEPVGHGDTRTRGPCVCPTADSRDYGLLITTKRDFFEGYFFFFLTISQMLKTPTKPSRSSARTSPRLDSAWARRRGLTLLDAAYPALQGFRHPSR